MYVNNWEANLSSLLPYVAWSGLTAQARYTWDTHRHNHARYELHVILEGTADLDLNGKLFHIETGSAVMIAPHVFHEPQNIPRKFCRFSISFLAEGRLAKALSDLRDSGWLFFQPEPDLLQLCRKILVEIDQSDFLSEELLSTMISEFLIRCLRKVSGSRQSTPAPPVEIDDDIERIDNFFFAFPPEQQTRKKLAEYLHCSERQLTRKFHALFGMTFQQSLVQHRIEHAKHLLRATDKSISEIAAIIGYADSAAFTRGFHQHTGQTPVQYRTQACKGKTCG